MPIARILSLWALCSLAACDPGPSPGGGGNLPTVKDPDPAAVNLCYRAAVEWATTAARCGRDFGEARRVFLTISDCDRVVGLRDAGAMSSMCLPFLRSIPCADFDAGRTDPSCSGQWLH